MRRTKLAKARRAQLVDKRAMGRAIAEANTVPKVRNVSDQLRLTKEAAEAAGHARSTVVDVAEYWIAADRKLGAMLKRMDFRKNQHGAGDSLSLADVDLPGDGGKQKSSRTQRLKAVPGATVRRFLKRCMVDEKLDPTPGACLRFHADDPLMSSETGEWYTPPELFALVVKVLGRVDLDPCSNSHTKPACATKKVYTEKDNGLEKSWRGTVYMNPPYGDELPKWVGKLVAEFNESRTTEAIALTPARTDTRWFRVLRTYHKCFLFGRLKFSGCDNSAPFPSMVTYLGSRPAVFRDVFSGIGDIYQLWER